MNEDYITAISERQRACFYIQKAEKIRNIFIYKKLDIFQKSKTVSVEFLYTKI